MPLRTPGFLHHFRRGAGYCPSLGTPMVTCSKIHHPSQNHVQRLKESFKVASTTGEVRAKNPSLKLNLGTNGLKVTSEPPPTARQADCLQGQDGSAVTHPSSSHARRCLTRSILNDTASVISHRAYLTPSAMGGEVGKMLTHLGHIGPSVYRFVAYTGNIVGLSKVLRFWHPTMRVSGFVAPNSATSERSPQCRKFARVDVGLRTRTGGGDVVIVFTSTGEGTGTGRKAGAIVLVDSHVTDPVTPLLSLYTWP
ncbi:hypothetical protein J6590_028624 [Homalodisca vitripennis]|nr:hypothetical protein J6590_028624 [Homalodisca vitripennis]